MEICNTSDPILDKILKDLQILKMKYVDGLNYLDQLKDYVQTSLSSGQNAQPMGDPLSMNVKVEESENNEGMDDVEASADFDMNDFIKQEMLDEGGYPHEVEETGHPAGESAFSDVAQQSLEMGTDYNEEGMKGKFLSQREILDNLQNNFMECIGMMLTERARSNIENNFNPYTTKSEQSKFQYEKLRKVVDNAVFDYICRNYDNSLHPPHLDFFRNVTVIMGAKYPSVYGFNSVEPEKCRAGKISGLEKSMSCRHRRKRDMEKDNKNNKDKDVETAKLKCRRIQAEADLYKGKEPDEVTVLQLQNESEQWFDSNYTALQPQIQYQLVKSCKEADTIVSSVPHFFKLKYLVKQVTHLTNKEITEEKVGKFISDLEKEELMSDPKSVINSSFRSFENIQGGVERCNKGMLIIERITSRIMGDKKIFLH